MRSRILAVLLIAVFVAVALGPTVAQPARPTQEQLLALWTETFNQLNGFSPKWARASVKFIKENFIDKGVPIFLLDVREFSERKDVGYIKGSVTIPLPTLPANIDKLPADKNTIIVTYCAIGWRCAISLPFLRQLGYVNVYGMDGGIKAWIDAGYPIEKE
ncbi:MAG: rhodanese-like domain-containing protein [Candidatus Bipolaricaulota bacterium]|nr:rhodanese-like domain-containing protein [Candidatus Bipolaricaulota bacterium]MDW8110576.1 rhodanese-like domain-containing protein [Candidatus Bipolaricaulota bacterium]MDW8329512.1 rhodanese-like domain-containing protein [Candidatus Bipolaricaulota bacterium]